MSLSTAGSVRGAPPSVTTGPRLARHEFTLSDGHRVGLAVAGRGVPLVVVHGFTAEGFLYAQTLHRLVSKGFMVVAVDMAGHGATEGLPLGGGHLGDYAQLMGRVIQELGIRKAVIAGHSMGGRVVAQLAAQRPEQTVATLLIDAIVGDQWDFMVNLFRLNPWMLVPMGFGLALDTISTLPVIDDPGQAIKLGRLLVPTMVGHVSRPWRLIGPAASILRTKGSQGILDKLALDEMPTFILHGDRDLIVPFSTARSAAKRSNGTLITVRKASHSWMLRDPETLPAIVSELLRGRLGDAIRSCIGAAGAVSRDELESIFYELDAPILGLTPSSHAEPVMTEATAEIHKPPRYAWVIS
ncbi:MAG: alpha/beta hydrolase [Actinomycetes bacterium]